MKIKLLFISTLFVSTCFIISCNSNQNETIQLETSNNIIDKNQLVPIIKDVLILESSLYHKANQGADMKIMTTIYYNQLYEKHSTDKEQLYHSIKYYIQQGNHTDNIFTQVVNELTVESDSIRKKYASLPKEENQQNIEQADTILRKGLLGRFDKSKKESQTGN